MRIAFTTLVLIASMAVKAEVTLPPIFSDHMVLQADQAVPVFGLAAAGETIKIAMNGQTKTATAGADGKWSLKLEPQKSGGPFELTVGAKVIKDVLVGEVWVAGGQSNMKFPLSRASTGAADMAKASLQSFRYFSVGTGRWVICSPQNCGAFSAVAFYFATHLLDKLQHPVGIIENAVNGAVAQTFANPKLLEENAELAELIKHHKAEDQSPSMHFKTLVEPVIGYGIKGMLWCQGEGNRDFPVTYRKLLPAIVTDWRKSWGQGDFPFLIVQLTNTGERKPEPWEGKDCALREAQLKISQTLPNAALVVVIDLGIPNDVHYPNKKPVGDRLGIAARGIAYGERIEISGPIFTSATFDGGKASVSFSHIGAGLAASGGAIKGFTLCGADKKWVRAEAAIEGDKVIVTSEKVRAPVAVRYAWERNPECTLMNKDGLPASPFRSDDFQNYFTRDGSD